MDVIDTIWAMNTAHFRVEVVALVEEDMDWSWDEDKECRNRVDSGELVVFCAMARVAYLGETIATDFLGGCVYRNLEDFKKSSGYFSDMVSEVCSAARKHINAMPKMRAA